MQPKLPTGCIVGSQCRVQEAREPHGQVPSVSLLPPILAVLLAQGQPDPSRSRHHRVWPQEKVHAVFHHYTFPCRLDSDPYSIHYLTLSYLPSPVPLALSCLSTLSLLIPLSGVRLPSPLPRFLPLSSHTSHFFCYRFLLVAIVIVISYFLFLVSLSIFPSATARRLQGFSTSSLHLIPPLEPYSLPAPSPS